MVSPPPAGIAAGDHCVSRAPAKSAALFVYSNLTGGTRCQPLCPFYTKRFLKTPSAKCAFPLGWRSFCRSVFCFYKLALEILCFITDESLDKNPYNF